MPSPVVDASARPTPAVSFARGLRLGLPVFFGYMPVGAAFGIVAAGAGFTVLQAISCSALVLAGAGQFIAVNLMASGAGVVTALVATAVLNLRYVLFGATLSPYLRRTPLRLQVPLAFTLTDETFGVNATDLRAGTADDHSMLGVGAVSWFGWTAGTALGAGAAALIGDPSRWGVEFAMPGMFVALLVAQVTGKRHAAAAAVAAALTIATSFLLPGAWPVVAGAMGAAAIATVVHR